MAARVPGNLIIQSGLNHYISTSPTPFLEAELSSVNSANHLRYLWSQLVISFPETSRRSIKRARTQGWVSGSLALWSWVSHWLLVAPVPSSADEGVGWGILKGLFEGANYLGFGRLFLIPRRGCIEEAESLSYQSAPQSSRQAVGFSHPTLTKSKR